MGRRSSPCATRRAASARPRPPSTWAPRSPNTAAGCSLVDFDPQGALSAGLGINPHELDRHVYNVLHGPQARRSDAHPAHRPCENVDLLPANIDLSAAEVQLVNEVAREQVLDRALRQVEDDYDVVLIDCQPSLGLLTVNA